ncbi:hypothetical protein CDL15_Pgr026165 [Punica granatum]|uniref:Uncharacterized protein n=1 Tax=Punica granatum TaxID=22663 RepID=A0A218XH10_PUNGR|nr:hypothetical protein CDL15_Pgr026165 [Punica granatum]
MPVLSLGSHSGVCMASKRPSEALLMFFGIDPKGIEPSAEFKVGIDPKAIDPCAEFKVGIDPKGIDPSAEFKVGIDPKGIDPCAEIKVGIDPMGIDPSAEFKVGINPKGIDPSAEIKVAWDALHYENACKKGQLRCLGDHALTCKKFAESRLLVLRDSSSKTERLRISWDRESESVVVHAVCSTCDPDITSKSLQMGPVLRGLDARPPGAPVNYVLGISRLSDNVLAALSVVRHSRRL